MRVTILGFTIADQQLDEILAVDAHMPIQTHSFAWAVVRALRSAGAGVTLLSADPVASFPGNPRIYSRGGAFTARGVEGRRLAFVNLIVLKHVTRLLACLLTGTRALRAWRPDVVLVHGVHSPFLLYARAVRRCLGTPVVAILTDPPGVVLPSDGALARVLKRLDTGLVRTLLGGFDGVVALTDRLASHLAPAVPSLRMEGIVDALPDDPPRERPDVARLLYAGGLSSAYGVDRMVEAVQAMRRADVRLSCFGRGDLASWVSRVSDGDPRIEAPRFASREEVRREYQRASVLVQPRPVEQDFVPLSFPSKLLEYLASGTPVVSTRLPNIPAEYEEHVYWADDDSAEGLRRALERVLATPWDERQDRAARAREFIWATRGFQAQGSRMDEFLATMPRRGWLEPIHPGAAGDDAPGV